MTRSLRFARAGLREAGRRISLMILLGVALGLGMPHSSAEGQMADHPQAHSTAVGHHTANYDLAARFAPYRLREMVHSTMVNPRWIEGGEKFWYEWENSDGKFFYIVDPATGSKRRTR